jgi:hypothetical protein
MKSLSTHRLSIAAACVAVALALGCGESRLVASSDADLSASPDADEAFDDAGVAVDAPIQPVRQFGARLLSGQCEKLFECCSQDQLSAMLGERSESVEECASSQSVIAASVAFDQFDAAIEDGRLIYDDVMAELCIESWAKRPCDEVRNTDIFSSELPGCREMLSAAVELGGACVEDIDCQSGYCAAGEDAGTTCRRLPVAGESCPDLRCEQDAYCSTFGSEYLCEARRDLGQECASGRDCKSRECGPDENLDQVCLEPAVLCPANSTGDGQ